MALFDAQNPNLCQGIRSTYTASSVTDMFLLRIVLLPSKFIAVGQTLDALEISALRNQEVSLWLGSPTKEATLLSTHITC
jgi:hypothetical protein